MRVAYSFVLLWVLCWAGTAFGTDWLDEIGINSASLPFAGNGAVIGQLEEGRPGKNGTDATVTINGFVQPVGIYQQDAGAIQLTETGEDNQHAVGVAGVMIASQQDQQAPRGVARQADLHSSALGDGDGAD